ncbi:MAG: shikimate kinase [Verrucomicrobiota bacterium]
MQPPRHYRNIALVGFMGVGKSTVGQILAGMLDFEFIDTDRVIETREGRRISDIFAKEGESHFRDLETNLIREYENRQGLILSTGGGLVVRPENLASLRRHALIVCLWASPGVIYERVRHQGHRPLLATPDPRARITELLNERNPAYQQADLLVGVDFRSPQETALHISVSFRRANQGVPVGGFPTPLDAGTSETT